MRSLNRNKRQVYYALYNGEIEAKDANGFFTGESIPAYGEVTALMSNVSAASGAEAVQAFGSFTSYSRTMFVADNKCPIDENSILWFGAAPPDPHNYIVVRKADSKNGILYALQEVTVT